MTERIRQLAHRIVAFMDQENYVLQDAPHDSKRITKPIPQGLLRELRNAVNADDGKPAISPEQIVTILRIIDLISNDLYRSEQEVQSIGNHVDQAKQRYAELRRGDFEMANDIVRAEVISNYLGLDPAPIRPMIEAEFNRRRQAQFAELKAITDANGDLPWEDHT